MEYLQAVRSVFGKTAPYILIELLLPGGTLIALLLYLYRRKRGSAGAAPSAQPPFTMFMRIRDEVATVSSAYGVATSPSSPDGLEALAAVPGR